MVASQSLRDIQTTWIQVISQQLATGEAVRNSFTEQLHRFFDLLILAVDSGDPTVLNPLLDEWVNARTESGVETLESSIPVVLGEIQNKTYLVAVYTVDKSSALTIVGNMLPVFTHAILYTTKEETKLLIERASKKIEKSKTSLEKLDKSKSDFISIAAHELKTPLTLVEGYTAMLREQLGDHGDVKQAPIMIRGINNGIKRLQDIIEDMIDVSMIDNNMLSLHYQPMWINRLVGLIQQEFHDAFQERNQQLEIRQFKGSDEMIFGDAERLFQAFCNVVSNAIKFTPDGGHITIDGRSLPGFIEVTITDTGIGVDPEDHLRIFEKFGRLGNAALHSSGKIKFKGGGPGLGLSIAKGIIEAHGGAIWIEFGRIR